MLLFSLIILLLPSFSSALCCYNHKWLCFGTGVNCEPNCSDGVSKCDLDKEICVNDGWGACNPVIFTTATVIADHAKITKFQYTATVVSVTSTQTLWATETSSQTIATTTLTTDAPRPTKRSLPKRGGVQLNPTSTITSTITDPAFCRSPPPSAIKELLDACTTVITTDSIRYTITSVSKTTTTVVDATQTQVVERPKASASALGESGRLSTGSLGCILGLLMLLRLFGL